MEILIIKLGATGDVVRTTTLLQSLNGEVTWLTDPKNVVLLQDLPKAVRCFSWLERNSCQDRTYDLVINLEDTLDVAIFVSTLDCLRFWGAKLGPNDTVTYTDDSIAWFDLSIISLHGRHQADKLKLENRSTYQELIFQGLKLQFAGEKYQLPPTQRSGLGGDVAIASEAGPVWPMKKWAYYAELQQELESAGLVVNVLPNRPTLLEHLADVRGHRCLVSGDSLPMHFALGSGVRCVSIFTCTSPWEIYEYGIQRKVISPLLEEFFYKRTYDRRATTAVSIDEVVSATLGQLNHATQVAR
jgi:ADP-heptose:LPS heptosyltransferase